MCDFMTNDISPVYVTDEDTVGRNMSALNFVSANQNRAAQLGTSLELRAGTRVLDFPVRLLLAMPRFRPSRRGMSLSHVPSTRRHQTTVGIGRPRGQGRGKPPSRLSIIMRLGAENRIYRERIESPRFFLSLYSTVCDVCDWRVRNIFHTSSIEIYFISIFRDVMYKVSQNFYHWFWDILYVCNLLIDSCVSVLLQIKYEIINFYFFNFYRTCLYEGSRS